MLRPDKATTQVRIVFDAAAKHHGLSLNDAIHPGPKLLRNLVDVLTRFRHHPIGVICDVSEMYLQVSLAEADRRYHRFLWQNLDTAAEPKHNEFQRLVF